MVGDQDRDAIIVPRPAKDLGWWEEKAGTSSRLLARARCQPFPSSYIRLPMGNLKSPMVGIFTPRKLASAKHQVFLPLEPVVNIYKHSAGRKGALELGEEMDILNRTQSVHRSPAGKEGNK